MKKQPTLFVLALVACAIILTQCASPKAEEQAMAIPEKPAYGGFESQEKWGEHLVQVSLCHDCHTPKIMTDKGPQFDMDRMLSGHPASQPIPDADRKSAESKGLIVTDALTAWVGPWGVSFAANLTSDATGIGNWQEGNFITAIREGKFKGIASARPLLPPMPWEMLKNMTDDELKAIFAFLKSTKPIQNVVPEPLPPLSAMAQK